MYDVFWIRADFERKSKTEGLSLWVRDALNSGKQHLIISTWRSTGLCDNDLYINNKATLLTTTTDKRIEQHNKSGEWIFEYDHLVINIHETQEMTII
jgi:hypothetical protein